MTKRQSQIIQGIAILLMVYHHFFLNPEQLSSWVSYGNIEIGPTFRLVWQNLCRIILFCLRLRLVPYPFPSFPRSGSPFSERKLP